MAAYSIFVLDEDVENLKLIETSLGTDYEITTSSNIMEAEEILKKQNFQVIITDQTVKGISGLDFLSDTNSYNPDAVKIILANYADAEMLLHVINTGSIFRYILKPWDPFELKLTVKNAVEKYAMANENKQLIAKLKENYSKTVLMLANTLEARDRYTQGHSERVAYASICLARKFNIPQKEIDLLYSACLLHDIGKIGVPEDILRKTSKLDEDDMIYIKAHTSIAERLLSPVPDFEEMVPIIKHHHERIDGKGYPDGLSGEEIPFLSRIIAVADTFDALTSDRPYRTGKAFEEAIGILEEGKGTQLDAKIVDVFISMFKEKGVSTIWEL